ncbi:MAG TPA: glycosyltransferase family 2 protein [Verrucomicrobiae bacterium]|nr:glycosyltransferase family 2 protein [Verrucomicrobiae bacterium]
MKVSLVISTFNQPHALIKTLEGARLQTTRPDEILISDDGSDEATREVLAGFASKSPAPVKHIWHPHDGFRKTVILNKTLAAATGDYLVFTDGDCVPHPKFFADHVALAEKGFWVQGRRCFVRQEFVGEFDAAKIPAWSWLLAGKITGATKGVRWPIPIIRRDTRQRGIIGCNMAFWREDLVAVNGFDEDYSGWGVGEDSDVGTRLYHLGRRRKFVYGRAITFHLNHPQPSRAHHSASLARLAETIATKKIRCRNGLSRDNL